MRPHLGKPVPYGNLFNVHPGTADMVRFKFRIRISNCNPTSKPLSIRDTQVLAYTTLICDGLIFNADAESVFECGQTDGLGCASDIKAVRRLVQFLIHDDKNHSRCIEKAASTFHPPITLPLIFTADSH